MIRKLKTADQVIDSLGGPAGLSRMFGVGENTVSQWRKRGLPPETYTAMIAALQKRGFDAPPALWRMRRARAS